MKIILFIINFLLSIYLYFYQKGIHKKTVVVQSLGYTSLGWKIIHGHNLIENEIERLKFKKDSISYCEIELSGKDIDPESLYFPYDNFEIEFKIDTIVHNINCEKPYSPKLKVINWWWQNKWLESGLFSLIIILTLIIGSSLIKNNYHQFKNIFKK